MRSRIFLGNFVMDKIETATRNRVHIFISRLQEIYLCKFFFNMIMKHIVFISQIRLFLIYSTNTYNVINIFEEIKTIFQLFLKILIFIYNV